MEEWVSGVPQLHRVVPQRTPRPEDRQLLARVSLDELYTLSMLGGKSLKASVMRAVETAQGVRAFAVQA